MVKTPQPRKPRSALGARSSTTKLRTVGVPLPPQAFAEFAALAAADHRTLGALGRIILLAYLAQRRAPAPAAAPPERKQP